MSAIEVNTSNKKYDYWEMFFPLNIYDLYSNKYIKLSESLTKNIWFDNVLFDKINAQYVINCMLSHETCFLISNCQFYAHAPGYDESSLIQIFEGSLVEYRVCASGDQYNTRYCGLMATQMGFKPNYIIESSFFNFQNQVLPIVYTTSGYMQNSKLNLSHMNGIGLRLEYTTNSGMNYFCYYFDIDSSQDCCVHTKLHEMYFSYCKFISNKLSDTGKGMILAESSDLIIDSCEFGNNICPVLFAEENSNIRVSNSLIDSTNQYSQISSGNVIVNTVNDLSLIMNFICVGLRRKIDQTVNFCLRTTQDSYISLILFLL